MICVGRVDFGDCGLHAFARPQLMEHVMICAGRIHFGDCGLRACQTTTSLQCCDICLSFVIVIIALVLKISTLKDHAFDGEDGANAKLGGFSFGEKVYLYRRVSIAFSQDANADDELRRDVESGTATFIEGFVEPYKPKKSTTATKDLGKAIVSFSKDIEKRTYTVKASIKIENLRHALADCLDSRSKVKGGDASASTGGSASASKSEQPKHLPGYPFLVPEEGGSLDVVSDWESRLSVCDDKTKLSGLKSTCSFVMQQLISMLPVPTTSDFVIAKRDKQYEVWAARDFNKNEIMIYPDTNEFKDSYWTYQRCTLVQNGDSLHPESKHVVCDGRLKSNPDGTGKFSLFFVVEASDDDKETNLQLQYTELTGKLTLATPGGKHTSDLDVKSLPQMPVQTNPKAVKKGTRLEEQIH